MAKPKSTPRGDQFEREYLLRMGLVKPADHQPSELDQLRGVIECCDYLLPVAQAGAKSGNAPEMVAAWLVALRSHARRFVANGGMGAVAPMGTEVVDSQLISSRK